MIPYYVEPCGCSYEMTEKPAPDGKGALIDLVIRKCALHENVAELLQGCEMMYEALSGPGMIGKQSMQLGSFRQFRSILKEVIDKAKKKPKGSAART